MYPPSRGPRGDIPPIRPCAWAGIALSGWLNVVTVAHAMPGFTPQTGQPCVACHVGPVSSPLGPFGRQVTLDNFTSGGARPWPSLASMAVPVSFTLTGDAQYGRPNLGPPEPSHAMQLRLFAPDAPVLTLCDTEAGAGARAPRWGSPYPAGPLVSPLAATPEGAAPVVGSAWIDGYSSRWHIALQKDLERHFQQIGGYSGSAGLPDGTSGTAAGGTYQVTIEEGNRGDNLSGHATIVHDPRWPGANVTLPGNAGPHALDAFRVDASYSFASILTPSIEYFRTAGAAGPGQSGAGQSGLGQSGLGQFGWAGARPNSAGIIAEVAYVPWAPPGSPAQFLNLRFAAQYVAYSAFTSPVHGPAGNNALYLSLWGALRF